MASDDNNQAERRRGALGRRAMLGGVAGVASMFAAMPDAEADPNDNGAIHYDFLQTQLSAADRDRARTNIGFSTGLQQEISWFPAKSFLGNNLLDPTDTTNHVQGLNDALMALTKPFGNSGPTGRGVLWLPPGFINIGATTGGQSQPYGNLSIPPGVSIIGSGCSHKDGSVGTRFMLKTPESRIEIPSVPGGRNSGLFGNFDIDGGGLPTDSSTIAKAANYGLKLIGCAQIKGIAVTVHGCKIAGILLDDVQNSEFFTFASTQNLGSAIVLDHGSSFNVFFGMAFNGNGSYPTKANPTAPGDYITAPTVRFSQTVAPDEDSPDVPSNNAFYYPDFDTLGRFQPVHILHEAGDNNLIDGGGIFTQASGSGRQYGTDKWTSMAIQMKRYTPVANNAQPPRSANFRIRSTKIVGTTDFTKPAIQVDDGCSILLSGGAQIVGCGSAFDMPAGGLINEIDPCDLVNVAARYATANPPARTVGPLQALALDAALPSLNNSSSPAANVLRDSPLFATLEPATKYEFRATIFYDTPGDNPLAITFKASDGPGITGFWCINALRFDPMGSPTLATDAIQRTAYDLGANTVAYAGGVGAGSVVVADIVGVVFNASSIPHRFTLQYARKSVAGGQTTVRKHCDLAVRRLEKILS